MRLEGEQRFEDQEQERRSPDYLRTLQEIEGVLDNPDDEQKYIDQRLQQLAEKAESGSISLVTDHIRKGFLGPKMEIVRSFLVDPFVMDDPELYNDLFETIRIFKKTEGWSNRSLREIIPTAIQWTLTKYLGNIAAGPNTEAQNREFYINRIPTDSLAISIQEFKGKGFSVCAEKAAVAQNLLTFVGIDSDIIAATGCQIPAESENEDGHYYNLIHGLESDAIYDPANPRLQTNNDGKLMTYGVALYPIDQTQSKQLLSGESVVIEHVDSGMDDKNEITQVKSNRLYTGPKKN